MKALLFMFSIILAAQSAGASDTARVYFPPRVADGILSLFPPGGAIIFTGNGWTSLEPGPTTLRLEWRDEKRSDRMVRAYWTFEIPAGRFEIAAERKQEAIIFSLRTRWTKRIVLRSGAFPIEKFEIAEPVWLPMSDEAIRRSDAAKKPNQSPEPTPMLGTSAAEQPLVPSTGVAHL